MSYGDHPIERLGVDYCEKCGRASSATRGRALVCLSCEHDEPECHCRPTIEYRQLLATERLADAQNWIADQTRSIITGDLRP